MREPVDVTSPDLTGCRVEVPPEGKIGTVIRHEPCEVCATAPVHPNWHCGYNDVIVEFEDGTQERHYEPDVIVVATVGPRSGGARSGTGLTSRPADLIASSSEGRRTGRQYAPTPPRPPTFERVDDIARAFHEAYERLAPTFGYRTRDASAVPWEDVPEDNKNLMRATVRVLHENGTLRETTADRVSVLSPEHQQQEERMHESETTFGTEPVEAPDTITGETEGSPAEPESPPQEESSPETDAPEPAESEPAPEPESAPEPAAPESADEPEVEDAPEE